MSESSEVPPPQQSPESTGTKEERNLFQKLIDLIAQRPNTQTAPPEKLEELAETTKQIGKPHVLRPPSQN
ncbi:MAG: hypothetical protein HYS86_03375 [Candidatus Chisholmbacteria bacterium]|nr:hypothetical protein [Candidatus Chisholmbacteria bacterium]